MKYRCLTDEELKELEEEFKQFLIVNGVHGEEWEALNKANDERVMKLVELFSDMVMEKALTNIKFLEHISPKDIKAFHCADQKMTLIGITTNDESVDFTKQSPADLSTKKLDIFKTDKPYFKPREEEIFQLLESGCSIIDEERYKQLDLAHTYSIKQNLN